MTPDFVPLFVALTTSSKIELGCLGVCNKLVIDENRDCHYVMDGDRKDIDQLAVGKCTNNFHSKNNYFLISFGRENVFVFLLSPLLERQWDEFPSKWLPQLLHIAARRR